MSRRFDDVTVLKDKDKEAVVQFTQKDFNPSSDTVEASGSNNTLTVTATIGGDKKYMRAIPGCEIQEAVKTETSKSKIKVTVQKTGKFNMKDKL